MYRDSGGHVTEQEKAVMQRVGGVDLALVAVSADFLPSLTAQQALEHVQLYQPDVYMPAHHDAAFAGHAPLWRATEPVFQALKDANPKPRHGVARLPRAGVLQYRVQPVAQRPALTMRSEQARLGELKHRLSEIADLGSAGAVLGWDQATYMPAGGAPARARQGATLSRLAHEKAVDPALGKLIDSLAPYAASLPYNSDAASLVRVAKRDFEKAIKVPADYVARASAAGSASYDAWTRARPANDFATMAPFLERTIELSREYAGFFAPYAHIADPLIDGADEGMTVASVRALFAAMRRELVPIVHAIAAQPAADDTALRGSFDEPAQLAFGRSVVERIGYDFDRGRLDKTHHPFSTRFSTGDVRITTRVDPQRYRPGVCSRPSTRPATRFTSRASPPGSTAARSATGHRRACTRASRGCGKTWSAAAAASGSISSRCCRTPSPTRSAA